jgi:hypothetical protein
MDTAKQRATFLGLGVLAAAAVLAPWKVLQLDGWPYNDESMTPFERIETFRRAFAEGIFYPIWTTTAHSGWGSPWPLFYHRLYSTLGALLTWPLGSPLRVVKLLTVLILFFGATGMRRLLKVTGATEILAVAGGLLFIFAPYTRTEWLARGAMSEFLAMALLPWIYAEVALFLDGQRHWVRLAIGVALLFHAHSMICLLFLTSGMGLAVALLFGYRQEIVWKGVQQDRRAIATAVAILTVVVVPHVIVASTMLPLFNTKIMISEPFRLEDNFHPMSRYLTDMWATHEDGLSLEISRYLLLGLVLLLLPAGRVARLRWQAGVPLTVFLLVWGVICFLLQRREFLFAYRLLPNSGFLQFPWRLLTFMTIGVIFLFITSARALLQEGEEKASLALAAVVGAVILSVLQFGTAESREKNVWYSTDIAMDLSQLDGPLSAGEYQLKGMDKLQLINRHRPFVVAAGCSENLHQVSPLSQGTFVITGDVEAPCRITLRQFQTPLLDLQLTNAELQSTVPAEKWIIELQPGHSVVRLRQRGLWEMVAWVLTHHADLPKG